MTAVKAAAKGIMWPEVGSLENTHQSRATSGLIVPRKVYPANCSLL